MYRSPNYPTSPEDAATFVAGQRHGYLIATPPGGFPQVSVLPFLKDGDVIELHCVQADPTFAAVCENPRVTFFVGDFLAFSPHHWVDPYDGGRATLHFRAVSFACSATTTTDPQAVAATLTRLLAHYEGATGYEPIADNKRYGGRLRQLAAIRLQIVATDAKFKTGPAATVAVKQHVVAELRSRSEPGDARAADVIEAYLPR